MNEESAAARAAREQTTQIRKEGEALAALVRLPGWKILTDMIEIHVNEYLGDMLNAPDTADGMLSVQRAKGAFNAMQRFSAVISGKIQESQALGPAHEIEEQEETTSTPPPATEGF